MSRAPIISKTVDSTNFNFGRALELSMRGKKLVELMLSMRGKKLVELMT